MELKKIVESLQEGKKLEELVNITYKHIPLILQRQIVKNISSFTLILDEETGFTKRDLIMQELMTVLSIALECSDLEIEGLTDEDGDIDISVALESYDEIVKYGIYDYIEPKIESQIHYLINEEIRQHIEIYNSTANVLSQTIKNISDKIPNQETIMTMMQQLPQQMSDVQNLTHLKGESKPKSTRKSTKGTKNQNG